MSVRGDALRLAVYLDVAGLIPACQQCITWDEVVAALSVQFFSLPAEVRREAKASAGYIMSHAGLMELGQAILPNHPLLARTTDVSCQAPRPTCDHCRRATWESLDAAVGFCKANGIPHFVPFQCPAYKGKWHITSKQTS